jgi:hypothetical protein
MIHLPFRRRAPAPHPPAGRPVGRSERRGALACLDAAATGWVACEGTVPMSVMLDRAMAALTK